MSIFLAVTVVIVGASLFGFLAKLLRQPLLVGYLFAGFALSAFQVFGHEQRPLLEDLSVFGVTFLLFLVGLEMKIRELRTIGRVALLTGIGQIVFTSIIGYFIAQILGFDSISSIYIAIALTFSSTIIVVQLLSEKHDIQSLYGKIAVGFLLVQDFVAILILVLLAGFQTGVPSYGNLGIVVGKGLVLIGGVYILSKFVLPWVLDRVAVVSSELLFITSIAWALAVSGFASLPWVGFSPEIGGFLAGLALANSSEHLQIASRVRPLRDFFITIFFFLLGAKMVVGVTPTLLVPAIIFSLFVLIGNPLIVMVVMGMMGYKRRTSFLASVTVAQISEFSLIIVAMGAKIGHIGEGIVGVISLVGVITMTVSTYLILNSQKIYGFVKDALLIFERKKTRESAYEHEEKLSGHIVLVGANRTGMAILPVLRRRNEPLLVVDFNPEVVERLGAEGIKVMYGDITDSDFLELLNLFSARFVISTVSDVNDNLLLLEHTRGLRTRPISVFIASTPDEALRLYEAGADLCLVPRVVSGEYLAHILQVHGFNKEFFKKLRDRHFDRLAKERF